MVTTKLNLSMTEPQVRQIYAKQGDTGRVLDITLDQTPEDGTLRILRPDGVEVTSEAVTGGEVESGSTFESLTEADVTELTVGIEPVQDLNGYDHPWVGGAGKNLLPVTMTSGTTSSGIVQNVDSFGVITLTGTVRSSVYLGVVDTITLPSGTYVINGMVSNNYSATLQVRNGTASGGAIATDSGSGALISLPNETTLAVVIRLPSGATIPNSLVVKPMIRLATETDPTWQPYSNICPIYPSNGKNLVQSVLNGLVSIGTNNCVYQTNSSTRSLAFKCEKGQTYTVSGITANRFSWGVFANVPSNNDTSTSYGSSNSTSIPQSFTTSASGICVLYVSNSAIDTSKAQVEQGTTATPYVPYQGINLYQVGKNLFGAEIGQYNANNILTHGVFLEKGEYTCSVLYSSKFDGIYIRSKRDVSSTSYAIAYNTNTITFTLADSVYVFIQGLRNNGVTASDVTIQIEHGDEATSYEPYNGTTYPLSLGRFVYGGTLDVVSGVLTVTHGNIASYNGETLPSTWISDRDVYASGTTPTTGAQVVYELATPLTYQLTAQQIKTLVGTNNVWASSGDIVNIKFTYGGLLSELPSDATSVVGKCYCDVEQNGVSSMPFTLNVKKNERES